MQATDKLKNAAGQTHNRQCGGRRRNGEKMGGGEDGAGDGIRTRDIQLGKLTLYQLSYTRFDEGWILRKFRSRHNGA